LGLGGCRPRRTTCRAAWMGACCPARPARGSQAHPGPAIHPPCQPLASKFLGGWSLVLAHAGKLVVKLCSEKSALRDIAGAHPALDMGRLARDLQLCGLEEVAQRLFLLDRRAFHWLRVLPALLWLLLPPAAEAARPASRHRASCPTSGCPSLQRTQTQPTCTCQPGRPC